MVLESLEEEEAADEVDAEGESESRVSCAPETSSGSLLV